MADGGASAGGASTVSPTTNTAAVSAIKNELASAHEAVRAAAEEHRRSVMETARLASRLADLESARENTKRRLSVALSSVPPIGVDPFGTLPDEVLATIVRYLEVTDVYGVVALLSRRWRGITEHPIVKRGFEASIRFRQYAKGKRHPVVMRGHSDWVRAVAVCPTRETIFTGSRDNTIR
jgi:epoxyqueuosine reductase QueG